MSRRRRLPLLAAAARVFYRVLLLAYPRSFRQDYGAELPDVFAAACEQGRARHGWTGVARRLARALLDVPRDGLRERFAPAPAPGSGRRPDEGRATASEWWSGLAADFRYARRSLVSRPGLTVAVVLTLALGIGANTAIFSVIDATLLARSPWPNADRMVDMTQYLEDIGVSGMAPNLDDLLRWRDRLDVFERLEARAPAHWVLRHPEGAQRIAVERVTPGYLGALPVRPILGRFLTAGDAAAGAAAVAVLPESLWRRLYRADEEIVGRDIELSGVAHTVVGVMPGIRGMDAAIYVALPGAGPEVLAQRAEGVAWMRPDVSLEQARAQVEAVVRGEHERLGPYVGVITPRENVFWQQDTFRTALLSIFVAVFLVLTIACVNVANLMLTSLGRRRGEFAVRAAIGASRGRIVRYVLAESALLAALGGLLGLAVANGALAAMRLVRPGGDLGTGLDAVRLDGRVLLYAIALSTLTAVLFGLAPALRRASGRPAEALQAASLGRGSARTRLGSALVTAETTLAVILLIGAVLMFQNFLGLRFSDAGFDAERVLTIGVSLTGPDYPDRASQTVMLDTLAAEVARVPGVEAVQYGQGAAPPESMAMIGEMVIDGAEQRRIPEAVVLLSNVQAGYFGFMGIPLRAGRDFALADFEAGEGQPERSVVITEPMAETYWPAGDALGARFRFDRQSDARWNRVVGISRPVPQRGFEADGDMPHLYVPLEPDPRYLDLMVRLAEGVAPPMPQLRDVFARLDPGLPTEDLDTAASRLVGALSGPRFRAALFGAFGIVAITLAVVGIFGVVAHGAAQRRREMAIRLALGASPRQVLRLVVRQGMVPVVIGLLLGAGATLLLGQLIASLLHGMTPAEPSAYAGTLAGFLLVAAAATWIPARRAMAIDVMENLRAE